MITLFIDTCTNKLIIGIYENIEKLYLKIEETSNDLSKKTLKEIDLALNSIHKKLQDVDKIYVVNGPGSFTGIRVGVTISKTLGWGLKKEIYPISELELLATTKVDTKYVASMIDARRGFIYAALYDQDLNPIIEEDYVSIEVFLNKIKKIVSIDEVSFVSYNGFLLDSIIAPNVDIAPIIKKHRFSVPINCHKVNPNYLKKTEAEEKLST